MIKMTSAEKVLQVEVTDYGKIELRRNRIEEYTYYNDFELKEVIKPKDPQAVLKVEVTDFDEVVLLREGVEEYRYKTHLKVGEKSMTRNPDYPDDGEKRLSLNFYYLEDAGYIDWWND